MDREDGLCFEHKPIREFILEEGRLDLPHGMERECKTRLLESILYLFFAKLE